MELCNDKKFQSLFSNVNLKINENLKYWCF